jgi:hypothetical protein
LSIANLKFLKLNEVTFSKNKIFKIHHLSSLLPYANVFRGHILSRRKYISLYQCRCKWETTNAYGILVGNPEGKRPLGRPRRKWVDNIKMDLREIGWDGMDWIELAQDRNQWVALRVP